MIDAEAALVGLKGHAVMLVEPATDPIRVQAPLPQLRIFDAVVGAAAGARPAVAGCREGWHLFHAGDDRLCTGGSRAGWRHGCRRKNSTCSRLGLRAVQLGRQKIPVVFTPTKKIPSKLCISGEQCFIHAIVSQSLKCHHIDLIFSQK